MLEVRQHAEPVAGPDKVLIMVVRAGVNFADLLATQGTYATAPPHPFVPG